jgi:hypothetical protein
MRKLLFIFAAICWTISLSVHLAALICDYDVSIQFPLIWLLHIGIFVVWLPTVFILKNNTDLEELRRSGSLHPAKQIKFLKTTFQKKLTWMVTIAILGFVYAIINFLLFILSQPGTPEIKDGHYILQNHGQLIKNLTENEYYHYRANQTRGFSGHWIAFYGIAASVLFQQRDRSVRKPRS